MNDIYFYGKMFFENILISYWIYGDRKLLFMLFIIFYGGFFGGFDYLLNYCCLVDDGCMVIFYD